uniref:Uncharacterized protein n=1 Tax=Timspurckia oligopyrenoides TaxID=708627 RepID=A0A7S0ZF06_9RHOD
MDDLRVGSWWRRNGEGFVRLCASMVLMAFGSGSFLGLSVYTQPLANEKSLKEFSAWLSAALGFQYFVAAFGMLIGASLIRKFSKYLHILALVACFANFIMQILVAFSLQIKHTFSFAFWLSVEGLSIGLAYIVAVECASSAFPNAPGTSMGLVVSSVSAGQIICTMALHTFISVFGIEKSLYAAAFLFSTPPLIFLPFYSPSKQDNSEENQLLEPRTDIEEEDEENNGNEVQQRILVSEKSERLYGRLYRGELPGRLLHWRQLMAQKEFLFLSVAVFAGSGPCFGLLFAFGRVAKAMTGMKNEFVAQTIVMLSVVQMIARLTAGTGSDICRIQSIKLFAWSGAKNLMALFFAAQTVACAALWMFGYGSSNLMFAFCAIPLFAAAGAAGVLVTVLARECFSSLNSALVIGMQAGVFDGLSTLVATLVIVSLSNSAVQSGFTEASAYAKFFLLCSIISALGSISVLMLSPCRAAWSIGHQ